MWGERTAELPPGVPINFWPPTLNNVSWSKDNIIAIGGPEHVALLVPKFRSGKGDESEWERFELRTNIFTDDEVPLMLPLSWRAMSVGEEQSEAHCDCLAWSPPGLGKHKRCVLAVLTANHVLSLWECTGKPDVVDDWKRVCTVNHALQQVAAAGDYKGSEAEIAEKRKARQRIRHFAWSQAPPALSSPAFTGATATLSQPYLAVSNDMGEVLIVKVKNPHDLLSPEVRTWSASVVQSFSLQPNLMRKTTLASCMPITTPSRRTFVDQLAWSPWSRDGSGTLSSVLATTVQSSLQCMVVRAEETPDDTILAMGHSLPRIIDDNYASPAGQMRWLPKLGSDGDMYLVYPCRKTLYCIVFNAGKATGIRVTKQPLDNAWDELSGLTFTEDSQSQPVVQFAYSINSASADVLGWPLPLTNAQPAALPPWQRTLKEAEKLYSDESRLEGHVMTRTYGMDASPLGDLLAINSSIHPTDGVEYIIASDQVSILNIEPARAPTEQEILPMSGGISHPSELSTEAALSSLQRFVERVPELPDLIESMLQSSLLQTFDLTAAPWYSPNHMSTTEETHARAITRQVRENILFRKGAVASRVKQLVKFSRKEIPKIIPPDASVIRCIVTEVVRMPHFISEASDLSQTITHIHCLILAKLDSRDGQNVQSDDLSDQDVETCSICSSGIAFESLRWARCPTGHQFTRCALSFLAIQTPGTAKFCGICNTQYMNEYLIPDLQPRSSKKDVGGTDLTAENGLLMVKQGATPKEPLMSLVRILFSAVDRCVCCGGKFVE